MKSKPESNSNRFYIAGFGSSQVGCEPRSTVQLLHVATNMIGRLIIKSGISLARTDNSFYASQSQVPSVGTHSWSNQVSNLPRQDWNTSDRPTTRPQSSRPSPRLWERPKLRSRLHFSVYRQDFRPKPWSWDHIINIHQRAPTLGD